MRKLDLLVFWTTVVIVAPVKFFYSTKFDKYSCRTGGLESLA